MAMSTFFWALLGTALLLRPVLGDSSCTFVPRNSSFELTGELMDYALTAADLSELSYMPGLVGRTRRGRARGDLHGYETFQVFRDIDNSDLAMVATLNGVCYATFRGTVKFNLRESFQLISKSVRPLNNCTVRRGYYVGYFTGYYDQFRAAVDECMQTSHQLIIAGQSQGGSNAIVAYMDLEEYNPIAITFGALRTIIGEQDCHDFSRLYRFASVGQGMYDAWVNRLQQDGHHVGQLLLLDSEARAPAAYLGLNDDRTSTPTSFSLHGMDQYFNGLVSVMDAACDPIKISGWEDGHWCHYDDECDSGTCLYQTCTGTLKEGEQCEYSWECESTYCRYNWHLNKACA